MNKELMRILCDDMLLELCQDMTEMLKSERQTWLDDETSRTPHFGSLIRETRDELEFVCSELRLRNLEI